MSERPLQSDQLPPSEPGRPPHRGEWGWFRLSLLCFLATPVVVILFPSLLLLALLMVPTAVALLVDSRPEKHAATSVGLLNFCGTLPALVDLWEKGQTLLQARMLLSDPLSWLLAMGAAALGWLLVLLATPLTHSYLSLVTQTRLRGLRRQQQRLVEEWGEDVALQRPRNAETSPQDEPGAQEVS